MSFKKVIILLGFPNTGKTSLFNSFTALNQKTVNYPGATVDISVGPLVGHSDVLVVDTPGLLSLTPRSDDERVTVKVLFELDKLGLDLDPSYELVLCSVIDLTQSVRHLAFIKPFIDAGYRLIIALNKTDVSFKLGETFNFETLDRSIPCNIQPISMKEKKGIKELKQKTLDLFKLEKIAICLSPTFKDQDIKSHYDWATDLVEKSRITNPKKVVLELDSFVLHPLFGPFIFTGVMAAFFYSVFSIASPFMDLIDTFFTFLTTTIHVLLPSSFFSALITDGLIAGMGGVVIFLPQIFILFFCIGLMEGSGFLARAAMLIDKPLSKIGLNGRSFVPLLSGCACAIPALMAARSIPGKKERLLSMFIIPLMQCSARLPVYGLLISLLFFDHPTKGGLFLTGIYLVSIILSFIIAGIGSKLMKKEKAVGFQMELPRWQLPQFKQLWIQSLKQTKAFILNAGPIILITSITLWFFSVYPSQEHSLLMSIGRLIDPLFIPMGVDWRVGVALLMSFVAREVFVSALIVVFSIASEESLTIIQSLQTATFEGTETLIFTPASIISLVVFFMISMQCLSTFAVAKQEMKSWKLASFQLVFYVVFGYVSAVSVYQLIH
jgi:ferrous iron transport protein B